MIRIRPATRADDAALWAILEPVLRAGETYPQPRDISREAALDYWWRPEHAIFVAEDGSGALVGTYYLKANSGGPAAHVANCGYMTLPSAAGRGIGRALCLHSLVEARRLPSSHARLRGRARDVPDSLKNALSPLVRHPV